MTTRMSRAAAGLLLAALSACQAEIGFAGDEDKNAVADRQVVIEARRRAIEDDRAFQARREFEAAKARGSEVLDAKVVGLGDPTVAKQNDSTKP